MNSNFLYTKNHEWISLSTTKKDHLIFGISDYGKKEWGEINFLHFIKGPKDTVEFGEVLIQLESMKVVSEILSPIKGKIISLNSEVEKNPKIFEKLNEAESWLIQFTFLDKLDYSLFMDSKTYRQYIGD